MNGYTLKCLSYGGARLTEAFALASSHGWRQLLALGKITKPSFWRLGEHNDISILHFSCKAWSAFAHESLPHCNRWILFCARQGLWAWLVRAITSKHHLKVVTIRVYMWAPAVAFFQLLYSNGSLFLMMVVRWLCGKKVKFHLPVLGVGSLCK